jgi:hypothetical protein
MDVATAFLRHFDVVFDVVFTKPLYSVDDIDLSIQFHKVVWSSFWASKLLYSHKILAILPDLCPKICQKTQENRYHHFIRQIYHYSVRQRKESREFRNSLTSQCFIHLQRAMLTKLTWKIHHSPTNSRFNAIFIDHLKFLATFFKRDLHGVFFQVLFFHFQSTICIID